MVWFRLWFIPLIAKWPSQFLRDTVNMKVNVSIYNRGALDEQIPRGLSVYKDHTLNTRFDGMEKDVKLVYFSIVFFFQKFGDAGGEKVKE